MEWNWLNDFSRRAEPIRLLADSPVPSFLQRSAPKFLNKRNSLRRTKPLKKGVDFIDNALKCRVRAPKQLLKGGLRSFYYLAVIRQRFLACSALLVQTSVYLVACISDPMRDFKHQGISPRISTCSTDRFNRVSARGGIETHSRKEAVAGKISPPHEGGLEVTYKPSMLGNNIGWQSFLWCILQGLL